MSIGRKYLREFEKERIEKMEERNIFVSARLRPLNEKERNDDVSDWECINDTTIIYNISFSPSERLMYPSAYTFGKSLHVFS